ncbi:MAG TPA: hypothetical protein VIK59_09245 [Verrucomicrobiae bacterium]
MKLKLLFIALATALLSGCVPVVTSYIAYSSAMSNQEHAAYTQYYFATAPNPVIPEDQWIKEYRLKGEYTHYYYNAIAQTNFAAIPSFEEWKTNEYVKMVAEQRKSGRAPNHQAQGN